MGAQRLQVGDDRIHLDAQAVDKLRGVDRVVVPHVDNRAGVGQGVAETLGVGVEDCGNNHWRIAGVGGAYFTIGAVGRFDEVMTAGKGFIGLAAMIFGNWNPLGAFSASLLFGFADSLQVKMQILKVPIAYEFLLMAPYIVTMIVLAGVVGRASPPAADGEVYEKS